MIYGKVGRLGHGKTMRMVVDGIELARKRGAFASPSRCWIVSNIGIRPQLAPGEHAPVLLQLNMNAFSEELAAIMTRAHAAGIGGVVLLDEVDVVWDAHRWQDMSSEDRYRIKQSRKAGWDVYWSAQFVDQVEKSVRNITEEVELVRAYPSPTISRREAGKRPWIIRGQRFRPGAVRELVGEPEKDRRLGSTWHRYRREHELLYDTDELVMAEGAIEPGDLCARHKKELAEDRCKVCHPRARGEVRAALHELLELATPPSEAEALLNGSGAVRGG